VRYHGGVRLTRRSRRAMKSPHFAS
jgi:hypothetical protein